MSEEGERRIMTAIAIAFVALIPSLVLGVLLWHEIGQRSDANRALIQDHAVLLAKIQRNEAEQGKLRAEAREAIRRADIANCEEDELVKSRLREIVRFKPEQVALTLEQLGIDPASKQGQQLTERAKESSDAAVFALRPRDCALLPDPTKLRR